MTDEMSLISREKIAKTDHTYILSCIFYLIIHLDINDVMRLCFRDLQ